MLRKACNYDLSAASFEDEVQRLMVLGSAGRDVAAFLRQYYPDEALDILTAPADGGRTALRANPLKTTPEALADLLAGEGVEAVPGRVPGSLLAAFEGSPAASPLFCAGVLPCGRAGQPAGGPLCGRAARGDSAGSLRRLRAARP